VTRPPFFWGDGVSERTQSGDSRHRSRCVPDGHGPSVELGSKAVAGQSDRWPPTLPIGFRTATTGRGVSDVCATGAQPCAYGGGSAADRRSSVPVAHEPLARRKRERGSDGSAPSEQTFSFANDASPDAARKPSPRSQRFAEFSHWQVPPSFDPCVRSLGTGTDSYPLHGSKPRACECNPCPDSSLVSGRVLDGRPVTKRSNENRARRHGGRTVRGLTETAPAVESVTADRTGREQIRTELGSRIGTRCLGSSTDRR
jgi:hypothetical protein